MSDLVVHTLSRDEARSLTDEVKGDAERLWRKLVELYDGEAHLVLGYPSWGAYFKTEFSMSQARAYQFLKAGRIVAVLESTKVERPLRVETQARELVPLLERPDELRSVWEEANVRTNGAPTAATIREVVEEVTGPKTLRQEQRAHAAKERVERAVGTCNGLARGLKELNPELATTVATTDEIKGWVEAMTEAISAIRGLRTHLKGAT